MSEATGSERMVGAVLLGRWRLLKLLGEGGMGAVFEADGLGGEGKRAIKVLHPEFIGEGEVLRRFMAEAAASQRLTHPNIARVFEFAVAEDGSPFLVMELLEGIPLAATSSPACRTPCTRRRRSSMPSCRLCPRRTARASSTAI